MDLGSFIGYIKTKDIYTSIGEDAKTRFGASSYKVERYYP